jgi:hypothetical protein
VSVNDAGNGGAMPSKELEVNVLWDVDDEGGWFVVHSRSHAI